MLTVPAVPLATLQQTRARCAAARLAIAHHVEGSRGRELARSELAYWEAAAATLVALEQRGLIGLAA